MTITHAISMCARIFNAALAVLLCATLSACIGVETRSLDTYRVKDPVLVHGAAGDAGAFSSRGVLFNKATDSTTQKTSIDEAIRFLGSPVRREKTANGERLHFDGGREWCGAVAWFFFPIPLVLPVCQEQVALEFVDGTASEAVISKVRISYAHVQHP